MKKIKITITQELELPDECSIIEGPGGKLIKYGDAYLSPQMEFMQSNNYSETNMLFVELEEKIRDIVSEALVFEKEKISEN